jgi:D-arabinose 1-dehydrogenase-like Zn-dependent alcohol dehydrogenase
VSKTMQAAVFVEPARIELRAKPSPEIGPDDPSSTGKREYQAVDFTKVDPVEEIMRITPGRGVDVSIEALGTQVTFENALKVLRPAGTLSSVGIYPHGLTIPIKAFGQGVGGFKIVTTTSK